MQCEVILVLIRCNNIICTCVVPFVFRPARTETIQEYYILILVLFHGEVMNFITFEKSHKNGQKRVYSLNFLSILDHFWRNSSNTRWRTLPGFQSPSALLKGEPFYCTRLCNPGKVRRRVFELTSQTYTSTLKYFKGTSTLKSTVLLS